MVNLIFCISLWRECTQSAFTCRGSYVSVMVIVCLLQAVLDDLSKEVGSPVKIGNYVRLEVGEGIDR